VAIVQHVQADRRNSDTDSNQNHRVNLVNYRKLNGGWQFFPVVKNDGKPNPKLILTNINGEPFIISRFSVCLDPPQPER
jgi:hypothetical protein